MGCTGTAWFGGIHPSATLTKTNRQSPSILIVHSGKKTTSEWLQKEKYVWVLMAQHVLCLVSDTAKKDVAFGQKASAHQQNTLKAQL